MRIDEDLKIEIRTLQAEGKLNEALRKLRMLRMKCERYKSLTDEFFVNYGLAWLYSRDVETIELCKHYLKLNENLFNTEQTKKDNEHEYYKWLWLNTEVYKDEITKDEYCKNFILIHHFYTKIGDERFSYGAIQSIVFRNENDDEIIEFMKDMIEELGTTHKLIVDMVADCKKRSDYVYIKVNQMINKLSPNKDKVII